MPAPAVRLSSCTSSTCRTRRSGHACGSGVRVRPDRVPDDRAAAAVGLGPVRATVRRQAGHGRRLRRPRWRAPDGRFGADCPPGRGEGRRGDGAGERAGWQETYRGLMSDAVLDDPDLLTTRERFWTDMLTDDRYRDNRVAVAEREGELIGIAMSGLPLDEGPWSRQLYVLYVRAVDHGTGAGRSLWRRSSIRPSRPCCGSPSRTPALRRSTVATASRPTGRTRSRTACGGSGWFASCRTGMRPEPTRPSGPYGSGTDCGNENTSSGS